MKPTKTAHILRKAFKDLGIRHNVTDQGYLVSKPPFPQIEGSVLKDFVREYAAYNLARKREATTATTVQMRNALEKWADGEWRCHVLNKTGWWIQPTDAMERNCLSYLIQRTTVHISRILQDYWPQFDVTPTNGATATTARKFAFGFSKVDGTPLTPDCQEPHKCNPASREILEVIFNENPAIFRRFYRARYGVLVDTPVMIDMRPEVWDAIVKDMAAWCCEGVPPAKLDYVAKNMDEVRLLCKSNSLSIMIQKIYGDCVRYALKAEGIDLNDQQVNQEWALIGSLTGVVATVDLSAASDSIALHHLDFFPQRWREYFLSSRDTTVSCGKRTHKLHKVAGMGNGYIFELESLLFYAMALSVVEHLGLETSWVSVYGDDIIIPSRAYTLLEKFFLSQGFLVNNEKSYHTGPFRESCGKHYYNGVDVTPWYARGDVCSVPDLYHYYNGFTSLMDRTGLDLSGVIEYILGLIPEKERVVVPDTWDTRSGLHTAREGCVMPRQRYNKHLQRVETIYETYQYKGMDITERFSGGLQLTAWLCQAESRTTVIPVVDGITKLYRKHRHNCSGSLFEAVVARVEWVGTETRVKRRV